MDFARMSIDELQSYVDEQARRLIEAAGSVDAVIARMRQYLGDEVAADFAAMADRYR
jgi:hypothetical protein